MVNYFEWFFKRFGMVLLDGGLATELEHAGFDLKHPLWSAKILLETPEAIQQVHAGYLAAGAHCITTATYQATFAGLMATGLDHAQATAILQKAVDLAIAAVDEFCAAVDVDFRPIIAASIGPFGAFLANGAEYTGDYGIGRADLVEFHRERWHLLATSGADMLACETIPNYSELEALVDLLSETPTMPVWVSVTCRDGVAMSDGAPLVEVARLLDGVPNVVALGVNCTDPDLATEHIGSLQAGSSKPLLVYPNSGEEWVGKWVGTAKNSAETYAQLSAEWRAAGATIIGGCCRTTPEHIRQMKQLLIDES